MSPVYINIVLVFFLFACLITMVSTSLYYIGVAFKLHINSGLICTLNTCAGVLIYFMITIFKPDLFLFLQESFGIGPDTYAAFSLSLVVAAFVGILTGLFYGAHFSNFHEKRFSWSLIPLTIVQFVLLDITLSIYSSESEQITKSLVPPCLFVLALILSFVIRFNRSQPDRKGSEDILGEMNSMKAVPNEGERNTPF